MRTVILIGSVLIADASRTVTVDSNLCIMVLVAFLVSVIADTWEFMHNIRK